jgi:hypothetical protein
VFVEVLVTGYALHKQDMVTLPTSCGRSVSIVRLRTETTEFFFVLFAFLMSVLIFSLLCILGYCNYFMIFSMYMSCMWSQDSSVSA